MKPFAKFINYINGIYIYIYPYLDIIVGLFFITVIFFLIFSIYKEYSIKFVKSQFLLFSFYLAIFLTSLFLIFIFFTYSRPVLIFLFKFFYPKLDLILVISHLIISFFLLQARNTKFNFILEYFLFLNFIFNIILLIYFFYYLYP